MNDRAMNPSLESIVGTPDEIAADAARIPLNGYTEAEQAHLRRRALTAGIVRLLLSAGYTKEAERDRVDRYQIDASYHANVLRVAEGTAATLATIGDLLDEASNRW